jgi:hypothetical protein
MHLAKDVYAAFVGEDLILLDVPGDRYLCVPGAPAVVDGEGVLRILDRGLGEELLAMGLAASGPVVGRVASRPCPRAARDLPLSPRTPLGPWDVVEAARATADAARAYAGRSLSALLDGVRRETQLRPDAGGPGLVESAEAFRRWAPFTPLTSKCLLRSFLLRRHLRRAGHDVAWVFGVKTWPFEAHCWIQAGDMVLNDSWERLAVFEPLLVV